MSNFSYLKNKLLIKQMENRISCYIQSTSTNLESKLSNKFELGKKNWRGPQTGGLCQLQSRDYGP